MGALEMGLLAPLLKDGSGLLAELLEYSAGLLDCSTEPLPEEKVYRHRQRTVETVLGEVLLCRDYFYCEQRESGRAPFDQPLGLIDGCSPGQSAADVPHRRPAKLRGGRRRSAGLRGCLPSRAGHPAHGQPHHSTRRLNSNFPVTHPVLPSFILHTSSFILHNLSARVGFFAWMTRLLYWMN